MKKYLVSHVPCTIKEILTNYVVDLCNEKTSKWYIDNVLKLRLFCSFGKALQLNDTVNIFQCLQSLRKNFAQTKTSLILKKTLNHPRVKSYSNSALISRVHEISASENVTNQNAVKPV